MIVCTATQNWKYESDYLRNDMNTIVSQVTTSFDYDDNGQLYCNFVKYDYHN